MSLRKLFNVLVPFPNYKFKIYINMTCIDDNLVFKGTIVDIKEIEDYLDAEVFQIIPNDFEEHIRIILR